MGLLKSIRDAFHIYRASLLEKQAVKYFSQNQLDQAEQVLNRARLLVEEKVGPRDPDLPPILISLATVYSTQGRYDDSEFILLKALKIWEKALDPEDQQVLMVLDELAVLYSNTYQYPKEEEVLRRVLKQEEKGPENLNLEDTLTRLAHNLTLQERYTEALPFAEWAVSICTNVTGIKEVVTGGALSIVGSVYRGLGRNEEAEESLTKSRTILQDNLGKDALNLMPVLNNLGILYQSTERYSEAENAFRQLMEICGKQFGENHELFAESLNNLANLYDAKGDTISAESFRKRLESLEQRNKD